MAAIHWASSVSGNFTNMSDWTGGKVPGVSDDAILDASGADYTVTSNTTVSVGSIQTGANATLDVSAYTFTAKNGTGSGANAGKIDLSGGILTVGGSLANTGEIEDTAKSGVFLKIDGSVSLTGRGQVTMYDASSTEIIAGTATATLTNFDNTISGAGIIGSGADSLIFVNDANGVVNATAAQGNGEANQLVIIGTSIYVNGGTVINDGLLEATGQAGLAISAYFTDQSGGGTIFAATGSKVGVYDVVEGGTLSTAGTGVIVLANGGGELDGDDSAITNTGQIVGGGLIDGSVVNEGTISINNHEALTIPKEARLSGGGTVILNGANSIIITNKAGPTSTLTNVDNTITGSGALGDEKLILVNESKGVIDATGTGSLTVNTLTETLVNSGLMEASAAGTLTLQDEIVDQSGGGTLSAAGGATVVIKSGHVIGGTLSTAGTGVISVTTGDAFFDGRTTALTNTGTVDVAKGVGLVLEGSITNSGALDLTGTGAVLAVRTATVDQSSGGSLLADTTGRIELETATITGGSVGSTGSGGVIVVAEAGGGSTLSGGSGTLSLSGEVGVLTGASLTLTGAIDNTSTVVFAAGASLAELTVAAAGVTLTGGGELTLRTSEDEITGAASGATLTNVGNRIEGGGLLGGGQMTLVNDAGSLIIGNGTVALTIDTGTNTIVNAGEIASNAAGGVTVKSAIDNTGTLAAGHGNITVDGAVTGDGAALVNAGTLTFGGAFSENVTFGASGELTLAKSQGYAATISGFSTSGATSLDLRDIGFVSSSEATFVGTASGGTLTVTDGTHTASIHLSGNYTGSTFTASSDGHGGTIVVDPRQASAHAFASHIAAFHPPASPSVTETTHERHALAILLSSPGPERA